jgi:23S rRNA (guanosine2251-2'-O)-methyltransferase
VIVYGRNPVREAIRGPRAVEHIWATANAAREPWLRRAGARVDVVASDEVERRAASSDHQGICAAVSEYRYADASALLTGADPLVIVLDQIQDPQNLGAICRTAECAGAAGVVIGERRSAEVTPAVCKASAGAVEHLAVARVRNIADYLGEAKQAGLWSYGAQGGAPQPYSSIDYTGPVALVLGSEGRGLRPRVAAACDALVAIPLRGRIESLSVSAAAAVLIYAAASQRISAQGT